MTLTPETAFDIQLALCVGIVWVSAVIWNRWYIRRLFIKTFVQELKREAAIRRLRTDA